MTSEPPIEKPPETKEHEVETITYCFECPGCGEWIENESRQAGKIFECVCGQKTKVIKCPT